MSNIRQSGPLPPYTHKVVEGQPGSGGGRNQKGAMCLLETVASAIIIWVQTGFGREKTMDKGLSS